MLNELVYITCEAKGKHWAEKLASEPVLGIDIETTGLDPYQHTLRLLSAAALDGRVAVFDLHRLPLGALKPLSRSKWSVFNGSFEYRHLHHAGLSIPSLHDVQLLDRLVSHQLHRSLAEVVQDTLGVALDKTEQQGDWATAALSPEQIEYAAMDALSTVRAAQHLLRKVHQAGLRQLYDLWRAALPVLAELQLQGQAFDWAAHTQLVTHWQQEHEQLKAELHSVLGNINVNSGLQLGEWLIKHLSASTLKRWPKTPKGRLKVDRSTLALHANVSLVQPLLRYKAIQKLLSTYGANYTKYCHKTTCKLHPEFKLGQTLSGRVCVAKPNTQQPPRLDAFRALFVPNPGRVLVGADYSQIELRVAALLSKDRTMLDAYRRGDDLHTLTAAAVADIAVEYVTKEQRLSAKAVNFGNLYGQGAAGLARTAKLDYGVAMSIDQARAALYRFHLTYPALAAWKRQQIGLAQQFRQVRTRLGLVREFAIQGEGYLQGEACNIPIQGSAAEVMLCALVRLSAALNGLEARLFHTVHDELILEASTTDVDQAAAALKQSMIGGFLDVFPEGEPLIADLVEVQTGPNWAAVH